MQVQHAVPHRPHVNMLRDSENPAVTVLSALCGGCRKETEVFAGTDEVDAWIGGELIQDALPGLSVGVRELLISGLCSECFDNLFVRGVDHA